MNLTLGDKLGEYGHNYIIVFLLTVFFPVLFALIYAKDPFLNNLKKRPYSILFTLICYASLCFIIFFALFYASAFTFIFRCKPMEENNAITMYLSFRLLIYLIPGLVVLFILSFWYKISLHANGIGFLFALPFMPGPQWLIWYLSFSHTISIISVIGIVLSCIILLWQRVASGAHTFWQVFWGFCCGFGITILMETLLR